MTRRSAAVTRLTVACVLALGLAACGGASTSSSDVTADPSAAVDDTATSSTAPASPSPSSAPAHEPEAIGEPTGPTKEQREGERSSALTVTPFITYAGPGTDPGTIEVAGFVPDVIEEDGTCTATLSGSGLTASSQGYADATSTSCGLLVLETPPGPGQIVVLSYSSSSSRGSSDPTEVTHP